MPRCFPPSDGPTRPVPERPRRPPPSCTRVLIVLVRDLSGIHRHSYCTPFSPYPRTPSHDAAPGFWSVDRAYPAAEMQPVPVVDGGGTILIRHLSWGKVFHSSFLIPCVYSNRFSLFSAETPLTH
jgi:hypothetical protein